MAKTESTAVNELIDLMQNRPSAPPAEPSSDLFSSAPARMTSANPSLRAAGDVAPLPRTRAPQSTSEHAVGVRMRTASPPRGTTIPPLRSAPSGTLPPARPSAPSIRPSSPPPPPRSSISMRATVPSGTFPPPPHPLPQAFPVVSPPDAPADHWYEAGPGAAAVKTERAETIALVKKLTLPTIALSVAMVVVYLSFFGPSATPKTTPAQRATPTTPTATPSGEGADGETVLRPSLPSRESANAATPSAGGDEPVPPTRAEQAAEIAAAASGNTMTHDAPRAAVDALEKRAAVAADGAPTIREVATPRGVIKFADVRIDSDPPGATVTLVDRGVQAFLGTTPLSTSVDASREYDVIIALDGRPTQMVHLDPATTGRLDVSLGRASRAESPRPPRASSRPRVDTRETDLEKPAAAVAAPAPAPAAAVTGTGTLMLSSKPPCVIIIDGEPTGLTTPQRSIELPAGTHKVTLQNDEAGVKKTFSVTISAGQATKHIENLMPAEP